MKLKKISLSLIILFLFSLVNSFAVTIQENAPPIQPPQNSGLSQTVANAVGMGLFIGLGVGIVIFIVWFIISKIRQNERKLNDLLFGKFKIDLVKCDQNRDGRLKWRNWKTFFLSFKRANILLDTVDGLKFYGYYDGEMLGKRGFVNIAVYRVLGIFKRDRDVLVIPYFMRKVIRKELINGRWTMILNAEGVDNAFNTDYYGQLVVKDVNNDNKLIDLSGYIDNYELKPHVLQQVIKDDLLNFKDSMDKAVEINPNIQVERKNPK